MRVLVLSFILFSASALALLLYVALSSRHKKSSQQPLRLVGHVGSVERSLRPEGFILIGGELWRARVRGDVHVEQEGTNVRVVGARGCVLEVERLV